MVDKVEDLCHFPVALSYTTKEECVQEAACLSVPPSLFPESRPAHTELGGRHPTFLSTAPCPLWEQGEFSGTPGLQGCVGPQGVGNTTQHRRLASVLSG